VRIPLYPVTSHNLGGPNEGLVTQFTFIQLPEPSIVDQLCPCAGPGSGQRWKNHGDYVSCVAKAAEAFLAADLITEEQKQAIVEAAVQSNCGKK
jgi:hypothetical protein